jgi:hypothetical protein
MFFSCNSEKISSEPEKSPSEPKENSKNDKIILAKPDFKKLICGKWKINYDGTIAQLSEEKKMEIGENLSSFKETFAGINYEFKENGNCIYNAGIAPIEGKTTWDINGETLEIKEEDKVVFSYEIKELDAEKLILKSNESGELFVITVFEKMK